jgi:Fe2+ transport system protein FeoA
LPANHTLTQQPVAPIPLARLRDGDRARLHAAQLCCEDCELLNALGLTDRCELRVCQIGEPCIVQVNATRLGLASSLADKIMVERM